MEKRVTFENEPDYRRFIELLYLSNTFGSIQRSTLSRFARKDIFNIPRRDPLVSIGAFCLMPNHFHVLLKTDHEDGITRFMRKLMTAYTMYFNMNRARTGNLFMKPFRSLHVDDDRYFQHVIQYIHSNPAELYEPGWKQGVVDDLDSLIQRLITYPYSSFGAFVEKADVREIIDPAVFNAYRDVEPEKMVREAAEYYAELPKVSP